MIIKVYYAGGRIDVFDTDRMTDGVPQPGNLLTDRQPHQTVEGIVSR